MEKTDDMPWWVFIAFSSISTRVGAFRLFLCSFIFSLYCLPWSVFFTEHEWLGKIFFIHDWEWFAMMVPMTLWYWISLKWMDNNAGWDVQPDT